MVLGMLGSNNYIPEFSYSGNWPTLTAPAGFVAAYGLAGMYYTYYYYDHLSFKGSFRILGPVQSASLNTDLSFYRM